MEDIERAQASVTPKINPRFILAFCFAQVLVLPIGLALFVLIDSHNREFSAFEVAVGLVKTIAPTWQLAMEPLVTSLLLVVFISVFGKRMTNFPRIVVITALNMIASGVIIVGRSLQRAI